MSALVSPIDSTVARLTTLHPKLIDLTLDRMWRILAALGHPERKLPPVIHVAGTNGKGSTIAFMRAVLEAAGLVGARLYLAASRSLQRALPPRRAARGQAGRRSRARRGPGRVRARQCGTADHGVRDHDRGRAAAVLAPSRRRAAARSRPGRPARCHQRHRDAARDGHHAGIDRSRRAPGRHARQDRDREGRHSQERRAGDRGGATARGARGDRAPGRARQGADPDRGRELDCDRGARTAGLPG